VVVEDGDGGQGEVKAEKRRGRRREWSVVVVK